MAFYEHEPEPIVKDKATKDSPKKQKKKVQAKTKDFDF